MTDSDVHDQAEATNAPQSESLFAAPPLAEQERMV